MIRVAGGVEYELTYKKVKRLNLRVRRDGSAALSAPKKVPLGELDRFVEAQASWIVAAQERFRQVRENSPPQPLDRWTDEECLAYFAPVFQRYYTLFQESVPVMPVLKVRFMKTRWGVCHLKKHTVTLNKQLMEKPFPALEYVVLHELVHFLHPNHQEGFHKQMAAFMPDYKARRALL